MLKALFITIRCLLREVFSSKRRKNKHFFFESTKSDVFIAFGVVVVVVAVVVVAVDSTLTSLHRKLICHLRVRRVNK